MGASRKQAAKKAGRSDDDEGRESLGRDDWVRAASALIGRAGVDGLKVEVLARSMGVSKGSFYWHFSDRPDLLQAVLSMWEEKGTEAIIADVEQRAGDPSAQLWRLMKAVFQTELPFDNFEAQLRAWAQKDAKAQKVVSRVDVRRMAFVTDLLVAAGVKRARARARADVMYRLMVGEFIMRSYGAEQLSVRTLREVMMMLTARDDGGPA